MRQYIIKNQPNAPVQNGNTITLKISSGNFPDMRLKSGVTTVSVPFSLDLLHPEDENSMSFQYKVPKELADKGIMLLGAYKEDQTMSIGLYNTGDLELRLKEMQPVLLIEVVEKASLKAVNTFPVETTLPDVNQKNSKSRKNKGSRT